METPEELYRELQRHCRALDLVLDKILKKLKRDSTIQAEDPGSSEESEPPGPSP